MLMRRLDCYGVLFRQRVEVLNISVDFDVRISFRNFSIFFLLSTCSVICLSSTH